MSKEESKDFVKEIIKKCRFKLPYPFHFSFKNKIYQVLSSITIEDLEGMYEKQNEYCHRCARCCRSSEYISITEEEFRDIADYFDFSLKDMISMTSPKRKVGAYLIKGDPCIFLIDSSCRVYDVRPEVCRLFPFGRSIQKLKEGKPFLSTECPLVMDIVVDFVVEKLLPFRVLGVKPMSKG